MKKGEKYRVRRTAFRRNDDHTWDYTIEILDDDPYQCGREFVVKEDCETLRKGDRFVLIDNFGGYGHYKRVGDCMVADTHNIVHEVLIPADDTEALRKAGLLEEKTADAVKILHKRHDKGLPPYYTADEAREAARGSLRDAVKGSLLKWRLKVDNPKTLSPVPSIYACALCQRFQLVAGTCNGCPLRHKDDIDCCAEFLYWTRSGDPQPMLARLESEYVRQTIIATGKPPQWKAAVAVENVREHGMYRREIISLGATDESWLKHNLSFIRLFESRDEAEAYVQRLED